MLSKAIKVMWFQLKQNITSTRVILLFSLIAIFTFSTIRPVNDFANAFEIGITPWVFSLFTNDYVCQLVVMAGVILLFCNAPFRNEIYNYILPRAGTTAWILGMILYIVILSLLYVLLIFSVGVLVIIPNIEFEMGWGKTWGSLALGGFSSQFRIPFSVNEYIIGAYDPLRATVTSILLEWACCVFLGLVTYFLNNATNTMFGSLVAAAFVFLDITIANEWSYAFYKISPVTMAQIHTLTSSKSMYGLTLAYAVKFFAVSTILLSFSCIVTPYIKKKLAIWKQRKDVAI